MRYQYPEHFKYPDERIFFIEHVPTWEKSLGILKDKPNITLEIVKNNPEKNWELLRLCDNKLEKVLSVALHK